MDIDQSYDCKLIEEAFKTSFDFEIYAQRKHEWANFSLERHLGVFLRLGDKFQDCINITFINFHS